MTPKSEYFLFSDKTQRDSAKSIKSLVDSDYPDNSDLFINKLESNKTIKLCFLTPYKTNSIINDPKVKYYNKIAIRTLSFDSNYITTEIYRNACIKANRNLNELDKHYPIIHLMNPVSKSNSHECNLLEQNDFILYDFINSKDIKYRINIEFKGTSISKLEIEKTSRI